MTKNDFLAELERRLKPLDESERNDALNFYREYFEEAGPGKESAVIEELGSPAYVAAQVVSKVQTENSGRAPSAGRSISVLWIMLLGILSAPLTLPILFVFLLLLFIFIVVAASLIFALVSTAAGLLWGGLITFISAFAGLFADFAKNVFIMGASLVKLAIGGLILLAAFYLAKYAWCFIIKAGHKILNKENKK